MASSEDGSVCACLREDGEVELYDAETGRLIKVSEGCLEVCVSALWKGREGGVMVTAESIEKARRSLKN